MNEQTVRRLPPQAVDSWLRDNPESSLADLQKILEQAGGSPGYVEVLRRTVAGLSWDMHEMLHDGEYRRSAQRKLSEVYADILRSAHQDPRVRNG